MGKEHMIDIVSANCRGLADKNKRKEVMQLYRKKKFSIICLQDIHISAESETIMRNEWGLDCIIAPYKSNARGVAILLNNNFEYEIHKMLKDENGNYIILDLTVDGIRFTLTNLYGPNIDNPLFYTDLFNKISGIDNDSVAICGDWNLVLNPSMDLENYKNANNPQSRKIVLEQMENLNLIDAWREINQDIYKYTWWKKTLANKLD